LEKNRESKPAPDTSSGAVDSHDIFVKGNLGISNSFFFNLPNLRETLAPMDPARRP
jgi:hypothetical protein